jgi:hypothetical protein
MSFRSAWLSTEAYGGVTRKGGTEGSEMGLFKDKMKDPVQGSAEVIEASGFIQGSGRPRLRLIVTADGVPPTPVSFRGQLSDKKARVPDIGDSIPVTVDRANPQNISIKWSELVDPASPQPSGGRSA